MLTTLRIKNLALVADLTLELQPGYNVITGETGAGKSILIGALSLLLGERADRTLIRSGEDGCSVEAVFDVSRLRAPLKSFLDENGLEPCEDGHLVVKRVFTAAGSNRQFVNGSPTTLNILAALGEWLVDIHGPHDHQSLLHPSRQLDILDAFGNLGEPRAAFAELVRRRATLETEKTALIVDEKTYAQQLDLLRFQVREISEARLQPDEEARVEQDYRRASNAAKLIEFGQTALALIGEADDAVLTRTGEIGRMLRELQRLDPAAGPLVTSQEQAVTALRDLQGELAHYLERIELDPARLKDLEDRLNLIQSLRRKYGATLGDVIAFGEEAGKRLHSLEARDVELARINSAIQKIDADINRLGKGLSDKRRQVIPKLSKAVMNELSSLGFRQCRFDVSITTELYGSYDNAESLPGLQSDSKCNLRSSGFDSIDFQFAPNLGEPARPLRAIASSGEMARVMLALKTVLAVEDEIPVLVFDEVDANVGGETAHAVGKKMRQIADRHQVLCITHLAPVAAQATVHFVVSKELKCGRTISDFTQLDHSGRVSELTRMLGGQSDAARKHAESLLK